MAHDRARANERMGTHMQIAAADGAQDLRTPWSAGRWFVLALMMMLSAIAYLDRTIISLLIDNIKADLNVSEVQMGLLQGVAFGAFYAMATLPAGWLVDRFSRKKLLLVAFAFWTLASTACGLAKTFFALFLARMAVGAGEAPLTPAAYSLLAQSFGRNRLALAANLYSAGSTIGAGLALGLGGLVIQATSQLGTINLPIIGEINRWQMVFFFTAVPAIPVFGLLCLLHEPSRPGRSAAARESAGDREEFMPFFLQNRVLILSHLAGFSLLSACAFGTAAWIPSMFLRHFKLGVAEAGSLIGIVGAVAGIAAGIFAGTLVDRNLERGVRDAHFRYFLFAGPLMIAVSMAGFWLAPSVWVALLAWGLMHFLWPFGGIAAAFLQIVTPPGLRGRISGLYIFSYNLAGLFLGPTLVAIFTEHVFGNPADVGKAIALNCLLLVPISFLILWSALPRARALVAQTEGATA